MGSETNRKYEWSASVEQLEDRQMMTADPLGGFLGGAIEHHQFNDAIEHHSFNGAIEHHQESSPDFWIDLNDEVLLDEQLGDIEQALANAHNQTGLNQVRSDYGFNGSGQTVAVIDSGIAFDHYALGGGYGSNYRVVGGWDFTENDANPYDDGPSGSHGTHVAGIVGADTGTHTGVATEVDLVGLRVFDDAGAGYFSWVESALQWVHTNRNSFENPITAVNLSLGTNYNADTIPNWAMLEEEFAQLEADGIFISVSAGNSFTSYNTPGLSYPAASSHVTPVMSVDDNGNLSYFSQRHSRAIAAPGRGIVSTVPDYVGNNNGSTDDWASFSGTSMAAPYVAGASVLIREAMEFVGYANITQDTIYDHMMTTADSIYDSATSQWYSSLNLEAAIDALMPTDDFGSSIVSAFDLGTINSASNLNGVISTLDDADYFKFTAGSTGTVTFTASSMTHDLQAAWQLESGSAQVSGAQNEVFTIDVVAGQEYTLNFSSADGLGYYDFEITSESTFTYTDLGVVSFGQVDNLSIVDEEWYRIEATNSGYLSVESFFDQAGGQVNLHLFDANMQEIAVGNSANGFSRVDAYAASGEEFFVCVLGTNVDVDLRLSNLVALDGTNVIVNGTAGDDVFAFSAGSTHQLSVNGVTHQFDAISISSVTFNGGGGSDSIEMTGTAGDETATLHVGNATLSGTGYQANAVGVEDVTVFGGGGYDSAVLYDSAGDDKFFGWSDMVRLEGEGFSSEASGFSHVLAFSTAGGYDEAHLYDSAGDDRFYGYTDYAYLHGGGFLNYAGNFDRVYAYAVNGGYDEANLYDSEGDDRFYIYSDYAYLHSQTSLNYVGHFERVHAFAINGGYDESNLYDSSGDDTFYVHETYAYLQGQGFLNYVGGFERVHAFAVNGGSDEANLYDSVGDDRFYGYSTHSFLQGNGFLNYAGQFERVHVFAVNGGYDEAYLYDSVGDDQFYGYSNYSFLRGDNFLNYTALFDRVHAFATNGGYDHANLYGTTGDDVLIAHSSYSYLYGSGFLNYAASFDQVNAFAVQGGVDKAYLFDSAGDDQYWSDSQLSRFSGIGFSNAAIGFDQVNAYSSQGNDDAVFSDPSSADQVYGRDDYFIYSEGNGGTRDIRGFSDVLLQNGLDDVDVSSTDYVFSQF